MKQSVKKYLSQFEQEQPSGRLGINIIKNGGKVYLDGRTLDGGKWTDRETGESGYTKPISLKVLKEMLKSF